MTKNFLNNQNYILGKTEKKRVLSKFFTEKSIKLFFYKISNFNNFIFYGEGNFLLPFLFFITSSLVIPESKVKVLFVGIIGFICFIFTIILLINVGGSNNITKTEKINFTNLKQFVFSFLYNKNPGGTMLLLKVTIYFFYILAFFSGINNFTDIGFLSYILGLFLFIIIFLIFLYVKTINLFFLIMLLLFQPFSILYIYIYYILIKGLKGYKFIKYLPKAKFLNNFNKLGRNYAENKYYRLEIKK